MTLTVLRALGLVTIQDLGRPGHMHEAIAPGGALVRSSLIAANRALGNPDNAAAVEILGRLTVRADAPTLIATSPVPSSEPSSSFAVSSSTSRLLSPGDELTLSSEPHRVAYLAITGGVAAPLILGSRAAHLSAGLGRLLRAGDHLSSASSIPVVPSVPAIPAHARPSAPSHVGPSAAPLPAPSHVGSPAAPRLIHILPGPDLDAFTSTALSTLTSAPYRVLPTSDRVGTRLSGPPIPRRPDHVELSRPMTLGALEVPRDGAPIVLGPEHPTTGGYPIVAVIAHADLDRFFSIRLGGEVRFDIA